MRHQGQQHDHELIREIRLFPFFQRGQEVNDPGQQLSRGSGIAPGGQYNRMPRNGLNQANRILQHCFCKERLCLIRFFLIQCQHKADCIAEKASRIVAFQQFDAFFPLFQEDICPCDFTDDGLFTDFRVMVL